MKILPIREIGGERLIGFLSVRDGEFKSAVLDQSTVEGKVVLRGVVESKGNFLSRAKSEFRVDSLPGVAEEK